METHVRPYVGSALDSKNIPVRDSGLSLHKLTLAESIGIIVGTNIGAGILGLAYASRKAGYLPLLLWLAVAGIFTCISMLYVAEICLRTKGNHQISGLAEHHLGRAGAWLLFAGVAANSYGALTAYIAGSGEIMNSFFGSMGVTRPIGSLLFFIPAVIILYTGLKAVGKGITLISGSMVLLIATLIAATITHEKSTLQNLWQAQWPNMLPVFNIAVFCFSAQYMVPEIARGNKDTPRRLAPAIIAGIAGSFILLAAVPAAVISLDGMENLSQVATITWGTTLGVWAYYTANVFALLAMLTSYWGLSGSLVSNIFDHFMIGRDTIPAKRLFVLTLVCIPPFFIAYSNAANFVDALYFAGTFGGVFIATLPIFMLNRARKANPERLPWQCGWYACRPVQAIILLLFLGSAVYAVAAAAGYIPPAW